MALSIYKKGINKIIKFYHLKYMHIASTQRGLLFKQRISMLTQLRKEKGKVRKMQSPCSTIGIPKDFISSSFM